MTRRSTNEATGNRVYRIIKARIISNELRHGERIYLKPIARELGVSMALVREALNCLVEDALVVKIPRNGFKAMPLTEDRVMGLYEMIKVVLSHELTLLEPAARSKLSKYEPIARVLNGLNRRQIADAKVLAKYTGDVFLHIVSIRNDPETVSSINSANDRLQYVRTVDFEHPELVQKDLKRFCELLLADRCEELITAIHKYHEQRIASLPKLLERL